MSPIYDEALAFMEAQDKMLQCTDFKRTAIISHQDGSHFVLQNAIVVKRKIRDIDMLLVWTEHCGCHAFFVDDLENWCTLKRQ